MKKIKNYILSFFEKGFRLHTENGQIFYETSFPFGQFYNKLDFKKAVWVGGGEIIYFSDKMGAINVSKSNWQDFFDKNASMCLKTKSPFGSR